jgi:hypothetical protein
VDTASIYPVPAICVDTQVQTCQEKLPDSTGLAQNK